MGKGPRVLFVGRSVGHFSYYDTVLSSLLARDASIHLLFDKDWSDTWLRKHPSPVDAFCDRNPTISTGWALRRSDARRERLFALRELRSYRSYITRAQTTD